jgi:sugar lactone lactonase YvrE
MPVRCLLLSAATLLALTASVAAAPNGLKTEAHTTDMNWNAVAIDTGRIFVASPRWTGSKGPQLAILDDARQPKPFPDAAWNAWRPGQEASNAFVNINAIHRDAKGNLWVVDTGSPAFGGDPLPGGAKLVQIDLRSGTVSRVIPLGTDVARAGSYVDDVRFNGSHAYLTDAGRPGLIVVELRTGKARRVLDDHPATIAADDRPIVLDGATVMDPSGKPLRVNADPLEVSNDGTWLYFGPLEGPWSRVPTKLLDDPAVSADTLSAAVEPWIDLPPVGGTAMGPDGSLYYSELATDSIKRRFPDGRVITLASDPALHWVDAPYIEPNGRLWLPAAQMDRVALFHGGKATTQWPLKLYSLDTGK